MRSVVALVLVLGLVAAPIARLFAETVPDTKVSWELGSELRRDEAMDYKPEASVSAFEDSKFYEGETELLGVAAEVETYKGGTPVTKDVLVMLYAQIARQYEEDDETTLVEQKMADFGEGGSGVFVKMKTAAGTEEEYDTYAWYLREGRQTIWVACSFDGKISEAKDAAEKLMKSVKVDGVSAGELKSLPWDK